MHLIGETFLGKKTSKTKLETQKLFYKFLCIHFVLISTLKNLVKLRWIYLVFGRYKFNLQT